MRQLGKPALLAATYKGDAAATATGAMEELESTLVDTLTQLERSSPATPGALLDLKPPQTHCCLDTSSLGTQLSSPRSLSRPACVLCCLARISSRGHLSAAQCGCWNMCG